jgi:enoyl-CoA hydratase
MSTYEFLRWEVSERIATVWLDHPPVNAVGQPMYAELERLFTDVSQMGESVDVIIVAGAGRHFCAGNDLNEFLTMTPENAGERMLQVRRAFFAIRDCPIPVIAAVQGTAVGTGLAIAASCDFVIAAQGARIGVTEIQVGVMGAAKHLARLVPEPVMRWMFLSGEPVAAEALLGLGAVIAVVAPEELMAEARRRAETIARHSSIAIRFAKRSLNEIEFLDTKTGYELEQGLSGELSAFEDSHEAQRAVLERRPPRYSGR